MEANEMSGLTPVLVTVLKTVGTLFFLIVIMKLAKVEIDRSSFTVLFGLSMFLGYFLFWFVEMLVISLVASLLLNFTLKHRKKSEKSRFVPPELEELRRLQDEEEL